MQASNPLSIGLISPYDYASHGGVNDHISKLANQFRKWGNRVRVIAPCSSPEQFEGAEFIPMGRPVPIPSGGSIARISVSMWLLPRVKAVLEKENFDVIHLHEPFASPLTANALSRRISVNPVKIATFHSYRGTRLYRVGVRKLALPYFRRLDGRIAVSNPAYEFISRQFPGNYEIIPNGIQVDQFIKARPLRHLQDHKTNILFLGRLEKRKGLKYLLSAYGKLKWNWPDTRLVVVGSGQPDAECSRIISERNIRDIVFTGRVSEEDKLKYYKSADIFCSPATGRESFGIVLLEAMASGLPIVASNIAGFSSVVTHGEQALLVTPKNDEDLACSIELLLRDPRMRRKLAHRGMRHVQNYRWEKVAGSVLDYYRTFLN